MDQALPTTPMHSPAPVKSLLLFGHSHLQALVTAGANGMAPELDLQVLQARDPQFAPWANWEAGTLVINPALLASVTATIARSRPDAVAVTIDGSQHFVLGAVSNPRKFDFVLPGREDLPLQDGAEVIPYGLMRQVFMHEQRNVLQLLAAVRAAACMPVYYLSVPPVITAFVEAHMPDTWETMQKFGASDAAMRFKLWALYMDAVRELCTEMQVTFLPPPAGTFDADGFLLERFDHDGLHGNVEYGRAVLLQIADAMRADTA